MLHITGVLVDSEIILVKPPSRLLQSFDELFLELCCLAVTDSARGKLMIEQLRQSLEAPNACFPLALVTRESILKTSMPS